MMRLGNRWGKLDYKYGKETNTSERWEEGKSMHSARKVTLRFLALITEKRSTMKVSDLLKKKMNQSDIYQSWDVLDSIELANKCLDKHSNLRSCIVIEMLDYSLDLCSIFEAAHNLKCSNCIQKVCRVKYFTE